MQLRHRVLLSMLSVVVISGGVSALVGGVLLSRHLRQQAEDRVRENLDAALVFYNQRLGKIEDSLAFTVIGATFVQAVAREDIGYLQPRFDAMRRKAHLDMLLATDESGRVIFRVHRPDLAGDSVAHDPLLAQILAGKELVSGTMIVSLETLGTEDPALAQKARIRVLPTEKAAPSEREWLDSAMVMGSAAAVRDSQGKLVGVLWAGSVLNCNFDLVDQVRNTVFRDEQYKGKPVGTATIFLDDVRISTNVQKEDGSRAVGTQVSAEVGRRVLQEGRIWLGPAWVFDDWYISAYRPIHDIHDRIVGILYVGALQRKFQPIMIRTFVIFALVTLGGFLLATLLGWKLARTISRPIAGLAQASTAVAQTGFSHELPVRSSDEIGSLTRSFNVMVRSIKERDDLLKERTRLQLTRSERLAAVGRLAAGVAHEINNPLTGVLTFAHLLLRDAPEGSTEKEDLQTIVDSTVRCKDIVQGLLNFSRQNEPHKALANLNDVLRKALNLTKNQARIRQTSVVEEMDDGLPQLVIDPNQIQEVAVNVIVNALDAMPEGGRLAVRTRRVREDRSDWAEFEISDTGCGIPEENLEHIFDPFFTTKRSGEGTGLGLAVSYGIVMEHGGQMNASSTVGQGTTMTVRLPIASKD